MPHLPIRRRHVAIAAVAAATVLAVSTPALAHVSVYGPGATQGGYGVVTFRVPTESETASTTGVTIQLPTDTPLAFVAVQPTPGWTFTAPTTKLPSPVTTDDGQVTEAVTEITWKATDGGVAPGEFMQFDVQMGPFPDEDSITFKAVQTYSDGSEVDWIEEAAAGSTTEPEHPAPVLDLAPAGSDGGTTAAADSGGATVTAASADSDPDAASKGSATTGIVLGAIGVVLGAAALVVTLVRRRTV